jgi:hypothetical protein
MKRLSMRKRRSKRYSGREFRPYVMALGQLALAWNEMQEMLAVLFWTAMGMGPGAPTLAVWHAIKSDRSQRTMLRAALGTLSERVHPRSAKLSDDGAWLLNEADKLEDARNDAIHSPLCLLGDSPLGQIAGLVPTIRPEILLGNPRAARLGERADLLAELRWCRDRAFILADFAEALDRAYMNLSGRYAWPDRPKLSARGQKNSPLNLGPLRKKKPHPRPPRSSRA